MSSLNNKKTYFLVYLTNTGEDLRMSQNNTAICKYNIISLVNCNLYHNYTNPSIVKHCHNFIFFFFTSGVQSLCDSISAIQRMTVDIIHFLVCSLL